jgi:AraC family transcriptional regulator, transcriptional activator of pobA
MKVTSVKEFYTEINGVLPEGISNEIGHFNIFDSAEVYERVKETKTMPYNRRDYYKISLIKGRNRAEYADKIIEIESAAMLFATPKVPYNWQALDDNQRGHFCIFTEAFLTKAKSGIILDNLPLFQSSGYPVFQISDEETKELEAIFMKMYREINSNYAYKYDLLRNYVIELIHFGQKLQPATDLYVSHTAAARTAALFMELLERQFPIDSPRQQLRLRSANDYATQLSVHVNHLNAVLKETTGKTTTQLIGQRLLQEAQYILKHTHWTISEIAYSLGFEDVAYFSKFFKKQTGLSPVSFRS